MIALHLGPLHAYERVIVLVLAIGPFLILGLAIWIRARQDRASIAASEATQSPEERSGERGGPDVSG